MNMRESSKKVAIAGMALLLAIGSMPGQSLGGDRQATINVSATIVENVSKTVIHQTAALTITKEHIMKGYIDVPAATILRIRTNNPRGYSLAVQVNEEMAKEVWVTANHNTTVIAGSVGFLYQPYPGPAGEVKEISYRIFLSPDVKPGRYPWPLSIGTAL